MGRRLLAMVRNHSTPGPSRRRRCRPGVRMHLRLDELPGLRSRWEWSLPSLQEGLLSFH